jgi:lipopolysaccharide transport system permease protein
MASIPAVPGDPKPILEIRGGPGWVTRGSFRELWVFRDVFWAFTLRFVKVKYKQAAVGMGWAILQPVAAAGIFALFLGRFAGLSSEGVPYLLFVLAGMVAWTYFSTAAGTAMESLISDQALVRKVYFPREVLPLAAVTAALVDFLPGLTTLTAAALLYGVPPQLVFLALPLPTFILVAMAAALGVGLSGINVYYRDVRYALPFVLQLGLFASPVIYSLDQVPSSWRGVYTVLNPVAAAIEAIREIVIHQSWPDFTVTLGALGWALLLLTVAYALFKRIERGFADRI